MRCGRDFLAYFGGLPMEALLQLISMVECQEYEHLRAHVENVLGNLAQVATLLVELFRSNDLQGVDRLDKELELTLGEKERSIGALRQHLKEHDCLNKKQ
jgi:hypothetical protein